MKTILSAGLFTLLLTGCTNIPYDPSEGHTKIAKDLNINEQDVEIISKCNFYPFEYGVEVYAKMQSCLFITTNSGTLITGFNSEIKKHYSAFNIPFKDIHCAAIAKNDPGKGIVYLYTAQNAITIALLHQNNDLNHEAVYNLEAVLKNNSIPILDLSMSIANPLYRHKSSAGNACPLTTR